MGNVYYLFINWSLKNQNKLLIIYDWIIHLLKGKGINLVVKKLKNEYKDFWTLDSIKIIIGLSKRSFLKGKPKYVLVNSLGMEYIPRKTKDLGFSWVTYKI